MKFRAALRAPRGGPFRQHKLPEGGPVPAPRSEPDAIRSGVSRRASDKGDGPSPPQPKGQVHFRVVPELSAASVKVDLRGRKVILKRALRLLSRRKGLAESVPVGLKAVAIDV